MSVKEVSGILMRHQDKSIELYVNELSLMRFNHSRTKLLACLFEDDFERILNAYCKKNPDDNIRTYVDKISKEEAHSSPVKVLKKARVEGVDSLRKENIDSILESQHQAVRRVLLKLEGDLGIGDYSDTLEEINNTCNDYLMAFENIISEHNENLIRKNTQVHRETVELIVSEAMKTTMGQLKELSEKLIALSHKTEINKDLIERELRNSKINDWNNGVDSIAELAALILELWVPGAGLALKSPILIQKIAKMIDNK